MIIEHIHPRCFYLIFYNQRDEVGHCKDAKLLMKKSKPTSMMFPGLRAHSRVPGSLLACDPTHG